MHPTGTDSRQARIGGEVLSLITIRTMSRTRTPRASARGAGPGRAPSEDVACLPQPWPPALPDPTLRERLGPPTGSRSLRRLKEYPWIRSRREGGEVKESAWRVSGTCARRRRLMLWERPPPAPAEPSEPSISQEEHLGLSPEVEGTAHKGAAALPPPPCRPSSAPMELPTDPAGAASRSCISSCPCPSPPPREPVTRPSHLCRLPRREAKRCRGCGSVVGDVG